MRFRGPVLGFFARRVGEPEVAADLMAETFARALVRYRKVPPQAPEAWLFTIARNLRIPATTPPGRVSPPPGWKGPTGADGKIEGPPMPVHGKLEWIDGDGKAMPPRRP